MGRLGIQARQACIDLAALLRETDTARIDDALLCPSGLCGSESLTPERFLCAGEHSRHVHVIASAASVQTLDVHRIFANMKNTTKLIRVDVAFLFQLADMTVGGETPAELQAKAFSAYHAAHRAVAADYGKMVSARKADGTPAYRLEAVAGLAEPRDGAKVFALWFSSAEDFSREARVELTGLCGRCMFDAAYELDVNTVFYGARQCRTVESVEWTNIM